MTCEQCQKEHGISDDLCVKCGKNVAAQGDDRCSPCGGVYHCNDPECLAPECLARKLRGVTTISATVAPEKEEAPPQDIRVQLQDGYQGADEDS